MPVRRFPPPWTVEDHNDACFIVKDHHGHALMSISKTSRAGKPQPT